MVGGSDDCKLQGRYHLNTLRPFFQKEKEDEVAKPTWISAA